MITFSLVNPKLISVNEQYMHPVRKTKSGRYTSYVCKSPYLKEVQSYYSEKLKELISDEEVETLKKEVVKYDVGVCLEIFVGLPRKEFYEYDVSNFIKALEDCIVSRVKIDDSHNFKVSIIKSVTNPLGDEDEENWRLKVRISPEKLSFFKED